MASGWFDRLKDMSRAEAEEHLRRVFSIADTSQDGLLQKNEMLALLRQTRLGTVVS